MLTAVFEVQLPEAMDESPTHPPTQENQSKILRELRARYEKMSPEVQYVLNAVITYLMLEFLLFPDHRPPLFADYIELIDMMQDQLPRLSRVIDMITHGTPLSTLVLGIGTLIGFVGSVDGARRIVMDQLPLYRAYVQVFLLRSAQADDSAAGDATQ